MHYVVCFVVDVSVYIMYSIMCIKIVYIVPFIHFDVSSGAYSSG
jgi:hypothetical protein